MNRNRSNSGWSSTSRLLLWLAFAGLCASLAALSDLPTDEEQTATSAGLPRLAPAGTTGAPGDSDDVDVVKAPG